MPARQSRQAYCSERHCEVLTWPYCRSETCASSSNQILLLATGNTKPSLRTRWRSLSFSKLSKLSLSLSLSVCLSVSLSLSLSSTRRKHEKSNEPCKVRARAHTRTHGRTHARATVNFKRTETTCGRTSEHSEKQTSSLPCPQRSRTRVSRQASLEREMMNRSLEF